MNRTKHTTSLVVSLGVAYFGLAVAGPLLAQEPKLRTTLKGRIYRVSFVAFSPDGKLLAAAGVSGGDQATNFSIVQLWDVTTGQNTVTLEKAAGPVFFSPDSKRLALMNEKNIELRDVATGKVTTTLTGHADKVRCIMDPENWTTLVSYSRGPAKGGNHDGEAETTHGGVQGAGSTGGRQRGQNGQ